MIYKEVAPMLLTGREVFMITVKLPLMVFSMFFNQSIQQVHDCTITIQVGNCSIAHMATQMGPMPIHIITSDVGPMIKKGLCGLY